MFTQKYKMNNRNSYTTLTHPNYIPTYYSLIIIYIYIIKYKNPNEN